MARNGRRNGRRGTVVRAAAWLGLLLAGTPLMASQATPCPPGALLDAGWEAYRADDMVRAGARFDEALARCPDDAGALSGAGYVALRGGLLADAAARFEAVLRTRPDDIDALTGLGLVAWRQERLAAAHDAFRRVAELDPGNETAAAYLAVLPAAFGPPPERPPLIRSDTTLYPARARAGGFDVRTAAGWQPFYINGVNLGAALPGRHPSEFPDSAVYAGWIAGMADMGANVIRTYTIHPPSFYAALLAHNEANPGSALWLIHGVWAELPPADDFRDPQWEGEFFAEMRRVVDLLHGRADVPPRPGHASGHYTADVSRWVLAYIIGREWEPYAVVAFNRLHADLTSFDGEYLRVPEGTPMEVWLARACEEMIAYEMNRYNAQRPIAYTNWPTLDPMHHVTESTVEEEVRIRTAMGEIVEVRPLEYDNDATGLDATRMHATERLPAGHFASFHAYPYYPDFMILDPRYAAASSPWGRSNYYGYLENLKQHHGDLPIVIAEYGVPASIGPAHLQPQGWHHGGLTEQQMADVNARMTLEIAHSGMAGGIIFAWIDEWFKKNWLAIEFEIPLERNRLWFNRLDAEQHYGMIAMDAAAPVAGATLHQRAAAWAAMAPLYGGNGEAAVRAASDEAYLWLHFDAGGSPLPDTLFVGFDVVLPGAGERRWPEHADGPETPVGIDFALRVAHDHAELFVQRSYNPFRVAQPELELPGTPVAPPEIENPPPGLFAGRWQQRFGRPFTPSVAGIGWEPLLVVPNRRRFARDSTEHPALGYNRGVLREGNSPDGLWQRDEARGVIEVRIPWAMLNVTDPSSRRVLLEAPDARTDADFGTVVITDIGIVAAARSGGGWQSWPRSGSADSVARFEWEPWEAPQWHERIRPTFAAMRDAFRRAADIANGDGQR